MPLVFCEKEAGDQHKYKHSSLSSLYLTCGVCTANKELHAKRFTKQYIFSSPPQETVPACVWTQSKDVMQQCQVRVTPSALIWCPLVRNSSSIIAAVFSTCFFFSLGNNRNLIHFCFFGLSAENVWVDPLKFCCPLSIINTNKGCKGSRWYTYWQSNTQACVYLFHTSHCHIMAQIKGSKLSYFTSDGSVLGGSCVVVVVPLIDENKSCTVGLWQSGSCCF